ncbi:exosome complex component RRP40 [Condylostylus longicornis]|uniref:exosome complex component RRP40 n=1 Tax=Condylostylus longicornis TaxID=2530218 RepID=UPI00244E2FA2|nr:exosome complex component RRP40 [Condylostylus longicornis]
MDNDEIIMPGQHIEKAENLAKSQEVILGPGLRRINDKVIASKAGILRCKKNRFYIDNYQKRYVPVQKDSVIGIVTQRAGDIFRVDIDAHELASLSYLAFEGATKKNQPAVVVGDLVFAKLVLAIKDLEPELVCVDSKGKKGRLGVLKDGFMFKCSINLVRKILRPGCPLLEALKIEVPYEIAVGMNGRIWIKGNNIKETIAIGNAILMAEYASDEKIRQMCENIGNILFK